MANNPLTAVTRLAPVRASSGAIDIAIGDSATGSESTAICMIGYTGLALFLGDVDGATELTVLGSHLENSGYKPVYKDPQTNTDPLTLVIADDGRLSIPAHLIYGFDYLKIIRDAGNTINAIACLKS